MALQDILKKILADADVEITVLQTEAKLAEKKLDEKAEKQEVESAAVLKKNTENALVSIETKIQSMGRREKAKMILQKKQEIIQSLLNKLQLKIESSEDSLYLKIITPLLLAIPDKRGIIFTPKNRIEITKKNCPKGISIEPTTDIAGGFIFKSETGLIDNSFANLIHGEFRSQIEIYFTEQLKFI